MRIYEIAPGEKENIHNYDVNKFVNLVETNCSDALEVMRKTQLCLYRGFQSAEHMAFKGRPREQRITFTSQEVVETFNEECARAGFKANRTNSISCTADFRNADTFGNLYYIFPINGFNFLWSPKIEDFGSVFGGHRNAREFMNDMNLDEEESWIIAFDYTDKDFAEALRSGNEISINGEYLAFEKRKYEPLVMRLGL